MMTRPWTLAGSRVCARRAMAICPSYSSPWMPPVKSTVGPLPFFTEMMGISTTPQPESLRDSGARSTPACRPALSKSIGLVTRDFST